MNHTRPHVEMEPASGAMSSHAHALAIMPDGNQPIELGSGVITTILGEGGAAIVYEIWVEKLGIKRAVKVLKPDTMREISALFESEMKLTAQLRHPNIVEIHTVGIWRNLPYIEMEKVDGPSLRKVLAQQSALPLEVCVAIGIVICEVLEFAHTREFVFNGAKYRGILHHDLKPENIMLTHKGTLKLMDFGIATPGGMSGDVIPGKLVGSLQYLSPEVLEGKISDKRSDIFSFGCILYECIAGAKAFPESRMRELVAQRRSNRYIPVESLRQGVPSALRVLLNQCLKTDPADRFPDTGTIARALEKIHRKLTRLSVAETLVVFMQAPEGDPVARFRKNWKLRIASVVGLTLLIAAAAIAYFSRPSRPPEALPSAAEAVFSAQPPIEPASPPEPPAAVQPVPTAPVRSSFAHQQIPPMSPAAKLQPAAVAPIYKPAVPVVAPVVSAYNTDDPLAALKLACSAQKYSDVLSIFETLTPEQASRKSAIIFRLRALVALKRNTAAVAATGKIAIDDAEFYLLKARAQHANNDFRDALASLSLCSSLPAEYADKESLVRESQYYSALCLTALYEADTSDAIIRQKALDCWFDVKYAYRTTQEDNRFINANAYIRQLNGPK
jgi:serine/threonine protein kinase